MLDARVQIADKMRTPQKYSLLLLVPTADMARFSCTPAKEADKSEHTFLLQLNFLWAVA
jgi:hypothetical protein